MYGQNIGTKGGFMDKDKLISELVAALDKAGEALAVAERETQDARKEAQYTKAMMQASNAVEKARKHGY
jgi:hypothetical protein